ncbi:MAG: translation initiation factor IF-2, partial [Desulfobacteraceae bacterium]|nr:translation initiation factor IF-2 [Desulfobacteraceae bacterium]
KIDKAEADPERVMRELSEHNLVSEDWGGDTIFSNVSAKQKIGINSLLDMILLQAEIMELKADPDKKAAGHVVEARLDPGRGSVATVLVQEGTLKTGDPVVCGIHYGKIRAMHNDKGQIITEAGPSVPVEVVGLTGVPSAGDELVALDDEKNAKQVSQHRSQKQRSKELAQSSKVTLEGLFDKLKEGEIKDLNLIIKADVHGSIEALKDSLVKLSGDEVKINIIHSATGAITESDVSLASVSNAIILGFNVRPSAKVTDFANEEVVDIRYYDIIYNAIRDIKDSIVGMMKSTFEEDVLGRADVREVFVIPKKGSISGSYITDGKFERGERVRLIREGIVIYDGAIKSLRRFKDDVKDVGAGFECGIGIENFNDIKVGDNLECYNLREIKPTLE